MEKKLLTYFKGDKLAAEVWKNKYAQPGEITPDDMHKRMAKQFARIEDKYYEQEYQDTVHPDNTKGKLLSNYGQIRERLTEESIYNLFKDFKYCLPQGSVMSQLGSNSIGSLSNCFVIGQPSDSYGGIFQKDEEQAQLMKRRGGVGQDISTLRPKGVKTSNAAKSSTGPVSFMKRFSQTTKEVAQDGRRGALMLSMHINHPDILDFIKSKRNTTEITGANISVKLTDEFMNAVENDERFVLRWPCDFYEKNPSFVKDIEGIKHIADLNVLHPIKFNEETLGYTKVIQAKEYWNEIIKSARDFAEPGLLFEENHFNGSPDGVYNQYKGITTNPCGEIFMQEYDACRLIAVNLFSFIINPFTDSAYFDFDKFYKINYEAMRLSDDLVDLELEHISKIIKKIETDPESFDIKKREYDLWLKIYKTASSSRRTGLGFTGLGDAIAAVGNKYDNSFELIENIMKTKMRSELDCTIDLAILRGPFEGWNKNTEFDLIESNELVGNNSFYNFITESFPEQTLKMYDFGRRNVSWSTVAPTGTVSLLTQTTSGIEPLFQPFYIRRKKVNPNDENVRVDFTDQNNDSWQEFPVLHPKFKEWLYIYGKWDNELEGIDSFNYWIDKQISNEELQKWFKQSPWYGSTANDIDWVKRVEVQALLQKFITHSISSTINLPETVTEKEVGEIYIKAWDNGLKGITVYREGSRDGVLVNNKDNSTFKERDAVKRPKELKAETYKFSSKGNNYIAIVGLLENKPYEVFLDKSNNSYSHKGKVIKEGKGKYIFKNGGNPIDIISFMSPEEEAITRLVSANLRHGVNIKYTVEQLQKTSGDMFGFTKGLARVLKKFILNGEKSTVMCQNPECTGDRTNVIFEEGCNKCLDCGSTKCG